MEYGFAKLQYLWKVDGVKLALGEFVKVRYHPFICKKWGGIKKARSEEQAFKVGMTGFEPAASRPPGERATGLRYIPKKK